ncbi:hypothetical protein [Ruegeria arenilitoris]|uniref:hypothetical protein n=1 Tax=Ruegeria arenilitoris TaxID=1173585 RepID=UPI00147D0F38|nr:hypothetical protein [Ruegeria arenilitoris]
MSDVEGSGGKNEDIAAELSSKCWEARLEIARKQRAAALADVQQSSHLEMSPEIDIEAPQEDSPAEPGEFKLEQVVFKSSQSKYPIQPPRKQRVNRMYPIVFGAMFCGAALHWAATSVLAGWRNPDAVVQTSLSIDTTSEIDANANPVAGDPNDGDTTLSSLESDAAEPISRFAKMTHKTSTANTGPGSERSSSVVPMNYAPAWGETLLPPVIQGSYEPVAPLTTVPDLVIARATAPRSVLVIPEKHDSLPNHDQPAETGVSLFVPVGVSNETSIAVLEILTSDQTDVIATARVNYAVKATQVRFYHPKDAQIAELTANLLGGISRDFTKSGLKTRPGHIEVYLAGKGGGRKRQPNRGPDSVERFVARIIEEFQ